MTTLQIIKILLSLANALISRARDKKLISLGEANATSEALKTMVRRIDRARAARRNARLHPDDPYNRD